LIFYNFDLDRSSETDDNDDDDARPLSKSKSGINEKHSLKQ
jgi:hypothetical protein